MEASRVTEYLCEQYMVQTVTILRKEPKVRISKSTRSIPVHIPEMRSVTVKASVMFIN